MSRYRIGLWHTRIRFSGAEMQPEWSDLWRFKVANPDFEVQVDHGQYAKTAKVLQDWLNWNGKHPMSVWIRNYWSERLR